ncbi:hypothetical protein FEE95_21845 [Maribacter algarum]|uniref:Uncharacterized protein n=1 Tax=Maribacter algarum (ex Zhang et al. 2020) TaxID=2578118 RepID=A0A5S3Q497_9FLAO|nr:hypothetical protein [Maribacter algarum]TMM51444.1 hypothetical protein FEE95_21845 [Maribacter algarum]
MIKIFSKFTIFLLILGCNSVGKEKSKLELDNDVSIKLEKSVEPARQENMSEIVKHEKGELSKKQTLKERINGLKSGCFDKSMDMIFAENGNTEEVVDSKTEDWIFGLEIKDSLQFEPVDLLRPLCKMSENEQILSVAFSDFEDYKEAIHIFNFRKSDFEPISSFIIYSQGGDAEQFWTTTYEKMDIWNYKIIEAEGHYEFGEDKTTSIIEKQKLKVISIDESTGKLNKKLIETE